MDSNIGWLISFGKIHKIPHSKVENYNFTGWQHFNKPFNHNQSQFSGVAESLISCMSNVKSYNKIKSDLPSHN